MPIKPPQGRQPDPQRTPFALQDAVTYERWRARKLRRHACLLEPQRVVVAHLARPSTAECLELVRACRRTNFALYQTDPEFTARAEDVLAFGGRLGLQRGDRHPHTPRNGVATLRREAGNQRARYIPYTDRAMTWHTDGYYNPAGAAVRGIIMHCVTPAAEGGASWLLDPEMVYIALRDESPAFVDALMQPDVMTIPANTLEPGAREHPVSGPVFSIAPSDGSLHMRYTARTRSIHWKDDADTRSAVAFLEELLTPPVPFAFQVRLRAGEGIVCNNVLHARESFRDAPGSRRQRQLWRARYLDRIAGTSEPYREGPECDF